MFGLCGWIGGGAGLASGGERATLDAMARGLRSALGVNGGDGFRRSARSVSLALATPGPGGDGDDSGTAWAAIEGEPRWLDDQLASLARAKGQAAALLEAFRRHGPGLLDRLRGHCALAIIEPATGRALLAVDRFGVYGLCLVEPKAGTLVFGTTTDVVRAHPGVTVRVGPQQIHDYLFASVMPAPGTIYDTMSKLRPGECVVVDGASIRIRPYYDVPYAESADDERALGEAARREIEGAMRRALDACADRRVGPS